MAQSTTIVNAKALYVSVAAQDISGSLASAQLTVNMQNAQHFTADGQPELCVALGQPLSAGGCAGGEVADERGDRITGSGFGCVGGAAVA